jgi:hypothetical protein
MDLIHAQIGVGAVGQSDRSRCPRNFLHHDDMRQITHIDATVLLADGHAEQPQIAELLPQIGGELVVPIDLVGPWGDFFLGEGAYRIAQHVEGFAPVEFQAMEGHFVS